MSKKPVASSIVLVGPSHPYTGGIAQHTTRLALELEQRGYDVVVESWKAQYPKKLYPGPDRVPDGEPEVGVPTTLNENLAWYSPLSWWTVGRRLAKATSVALSVPTPFHAVPYLVMLAAMGKNPTSIAMVHNVLPHEPSVFDRVLMGALLRRCDRVVVHNSQAATQAESLGVNSSRIEVRSLPSPWPWQKPRGATKSSRQSPTALFFGTIRHYKGLDLLLEALADTKGISLLVAGEFWDDRGDYDNAIERLGLSDRVTIRAGYVAQADFADVFGSADVLVLPYRSGSGSIVRELAFRFGLPVIATSVGSIAEGVESGTNGLVIPPGDTAALAEALQAASEKTTLESWKKGVGSQRQKQARQWQEYCDVITLVK